MPIKELAGVMISKLASTNGTSPVHLEETHTIQVETVSPRWPCQGRPRNTARVKTAKAAFAAVQAGYLMAMRPCLRGSFAGRKAQISQFRSQNR